MVASRGFSTSGPYSSFGSIQFVICPYRCWYPRLLSFMSMLFSTYTHVWFLSQNQPTALLRGLALNRFQCFCSCKQTKRCHLGLNVYYFSIQLRIFLLHHRLFWLISWSQVTGVTSPASGWGRCSVMSYRLDENLSHAKDFQQDPEGQFLCLLCTF